MLSSRHPNIKFFLEKEKNGKYIQYIVFSRVFKRSISISLYTTFLSFSISSPLNLINDENYEVVNL